MRQCRRLRWKLQIWNLPLPLPEAASESRSSSGTCDSRRRGPGCFSNDRLEEELTARWSRLVPPSAAACRHDPRQYESSRSSMRQLERHAAVNAGSKLVASRRAALWDLIREHPSRGGWTLKGGGRLSSWAPPSEVGLTGIDLALRVGLPLAPCASGSHYFKLPVNSEWKAGSGCQCHDDHDAGSAAQIGVRLTLTVTPPRYFFAPGAVARPGPRLVLCQVDFTMSSLLRTPLVSDDVRPPHSTVP
jgi:hypothetical protein